MLNIIKKIKHRNEVKLVAKIHADFDQATNELINWAKGYEYPKDTRAVMLDKIGFMGHPEVKDYRNQIRQKNIADDIMQRVVYYQTHYPNNKFITEESVEKLCKKWKLYLGEIEYFIGYIPDFNVKEMVKFQLREDDLTEDNGYSFKRRKSMLICAPLKDFDKNAMWRVNTDGYTLSNVPDPVVLQPVKDGYLIVSKWGPEAADESLINEKMN